MKGALSSVRPAGGHLPIYFGGASDDAVRVGGRHADVYAFWGEPLDGIRQRIAEVQAAAAAAGRTVDRFSVSLRPIAADTEEAAWERANEILERTQERAAEYVGLRNTAGSEGSQRLLRYAGADEDLHDKRLWTALSKATGAAGNSTALVGSYEQVAESLLDYVAVGATHAADPRLRPGRRRRRLRQPRPARAREGRRRHPRLPRRRRLCTR